MPQLHLLSPKGFRAGAVKAGIKSSGNLDVGLLICDSRATAAAVFTTNKVVSPAVVTGRKHISRGQLRGVVVNAGNANACTGQRGLNDAISMCKMAAGHVGCDPHEILPSSTGIIGHHLPMEKVAAGIDGAFADLGDSLEHALRFSDAILTTDLKRKQAAATFKIGKQTVTIAGVCKGSGMIGPRLALHATMLAYLTTDASISAPALRKIMARSADLSFNCVTVDDHASTNDTACVLASGQSATIRSAADLKKFAAALTEVSQSLAYQIAADGEGATKVIRVEVSGTKTELIAKTMARAIANSPLVKCAMAGNDPNWGRIVSAAGMAGVPFDPDKAQLKLQGTTVYRRGQPASFDAAALSKALSAKEVRVELSCHSGSEKGTIWCCDLTKDYVSINADYHT